MNVGNSNRFLTGSLGPAQSDTVMNGNNVTFASGARRVCAVWGVCHCLAQPAPTQPSHRRRPQQHDYLRLSSRFC